MAILDSNKLENLMSKPFRVSLNLRLQGYYKDNVITLTMEQPTSELIDPKLNDISLLQKNVEAGFLNIIDNDGTVLFQSFGMPKVAMKTEEKVKEPTKLTDDEIEIITNIISQPISAIEQFVNTCDKQQMLSYLMILESKNGKPRKTLMRIIKEKMNTLTIGNEKGKE